MSGGRNQLSGVDHPAPQPPLGGPKTIRRIQGSNSLSVTVSKSKDVAISQARSKLSPIHMNHQYPVLESGALPPRLGKQQTPKIRASQIKKPREVRHLSWNIFAWSCLRGKATSRSTSKGLVISEPSNPVHLTPSHGNGSPKALERLPYLSQETDRQSTSLEYGDGEDPAIRDAPLQPRSHPLGLEVILTPDSELTEPHFNSSQPPTPPSLAPDIRNSRSRNLTVSDSWHSAYILEHKKVCRLERRLIDLQREGKRPDHIENKDETLLTEIAVRLQNAEEKLKMQELKFKETIEALQTACLERSDEVITYRAEASQQRKYADHWRFLYENQVAKLDSIQKQLQQQDHEHPLADQALNARPLNREHPLKETSSSPESAQCAHIDSREITVLSGAPMELDEISIPPTSAREVPRLTTPSVICELSASASHEILQSNGPVSQNNEEAPVTQEVPVIPDEENVNPALAVVEGMTGSEQEIHEIPYELPELLALRASFGDIFSVSERQPHQQRESEEEEAPSSPASSQLSHPQSSSAPEEEVNEAHSTRTRQVIYRFGSPRIDPTPPVFRVRLSNRARGSLTTEAILRMEGWEWDSVPELELRDPRDGGDEL
jgi:hypothetical protein